MRFMCGWSVIQFVPLLLLANTALNGFLGVHLCCNPIGRMRCNQLVRTLHSGLPLFTAITKIFTHSKMGHSREDEFLV